VSKDHKTLIAVRLEKKSLANIKGLFLILACVLSIIGLFAVLRAGVCYLELKDISYQCIIKGYRHAKSR